MPPAWSPWRRRAAGFAARVAWSRGSGNSRGSGTRRPTCAGSGGCMCEALAAACEAAPPAHARPLGAHASARCHADHMPRSNAARMHAPRLRRRRGPAAWPATCHAPSGWHGCCLPPCVPRARRRRSLCTHLLCPPRQPLVYETEPRSGLPRVRYEREGWNYWSWRGHRIHYIAAGAANVVSAPRGRHATAQGRHGAARAPG